VHSELLSDLQCIVKKGDVRNASVWPTERADYVAECAKGVPGVGGGAVVGVRVVDVDVVGS
jgi:hypothetical protein